MTEIAFYSLWKPLLNYAITRGINKDSAQGLVMETIYKVIDQFNPERGEMLHFAYRVLANKMKNYFRDTNKIGSLSEDIRDDNPTPHDYAVKLEEEKYASTVLSHLKRQLDHTEIQLLYILQTQMENDGKYNVSVAARVIGIEVLKAHDIPRILRSIGKRESICSHHQQRALQTDHGEESPGDIVTRCSSSSQKYYCKRREVVVCNGGACFTSLIVAGTRLFAGTGTGSDESDGRCLIPLPP